MARQNKGFAGDFPLSGLAATQALGARIAGSLRAGDAVTLEGDLGAGQTTLAGAVLIEWPERAPNRIPPDALHITLTITNDRSRNAHIEGPSRWRDILKEVH